MEAAQPQAPVPPTAVEQMVVESHIQITLHQVDYDVKAGGNMKVLIFTDAKSGIQVRIPLDLAAAEMIAVGLSSEGKLQIAKQMPPTA